MANSYQAIGIITHQLCDLALELAIPDKLIGLQIGYK